MSEMMHRITAPRANLQINEKQLKKTLGFIEKGKQQGARLVTGGCLTSSAVALTDDV